MSLRKKQRAEFYYKIDSANFAITSKQESSKLELTNLETVNVSPFHAKVIKLGLQIQMVQGYALLLLAQGNKNICFHPGLIDPGYKGDLRLICNNKTCSNQTLVPGQLKVTVVAFYYSTPLLIQPAVISAPQYDHDVGFDLLCPQYLMVFPTKTFTLKMRARCPVNSQNFVPVILGRSGFAAKGLTVKACIWKDPILEITLSNYSSETISIGENHRICQVAFIHRDHIPTPKVWAALRCFVKLGDIPFKQANVSFIDICKDVCISTNTLNHETVISQKNIRGTKGLGSSGI